MSLLEISAFEFEKFLLILVRVSGVLITAPFFSHRGIPVLAKIGFIAIISFVLLPVTPFSLTSYSANLGSMAIVFGKELAAGLLIGFAVMTLFMGIQVAGELIGLQAGLAMAQIFDPSSSRQISIISEFQFILSLMLFLAIDGHHLVINAIAGSFSLIPPGEITFSSTTVDRAIKFSINIFAIALKFGAPVIVTLFLTDVALGIIARTVPQMNVFIVGFPFKIGAAFFVMAASFPIVSYVFAKLLQNVDYNLTRLIASLARQA